jgi:hypothetical protein
MVLKNGRVLVTPFMHRQIQIGSFIDNKKMGTSKYVGLQHTWTTYPDVGAAGDCSARRSNSGQAQCTQFYSGQLGSVPTSIYGYILVLAFRRTSIPNGNPTTKICSKIPSVSYPTLKLLGFLGRASIDKLVAPSKWRPPQALQPKVALSVTPTVGSTDCEPVVSLFNRF